jgi:hypothetical protein
VIGVVQADLERAGIKARIFKKYAVVMTGTTITGESMFSMTEKSANDMGKMFSDVQGHQEGILAIATMRTRGGIWESEVDQSASKTAHLRLHSCGSMEDVVIVCMI